MSQLQAVPCQSKCFLHGGHDSKNFAQSKSIFWSHKGKRSIRRLSMPVAVPASPAPENPQPEMGLTSEIERH